jgi:hypothetical protein
VVVIAEGSDGRRHFPAAVAGEIYRELNHRFGTAINMQVAATADDEEKEVSDSEDADAADAALDSTAKDATKVTAATDNTVRTAPVTTKAASTETQTPKSTVKRVLMPLERKTVEPVRNSPPLPVPSNLPSSSNAGSEQRPRRAQPSQP